MSYRIEELARTPNALAEHYSRFRVADRLLLTGHSHQAWPDVAAEGQLEALTDAAAHVDDKWGRAAVKADEVAEGYRRMLADPGGEIALGANTHELVLRFLSALNLRDRPRLVTTYGEFHTLRRQLARLGEEGIEVVRVPVAPVETLAERVASEVDDGTAAALVSLVLFETGRIVGGLDVVAAAGARHGAELLVDAYHALGVVEVNLAALGLADAWVTGGGYKYLQLGEGNCFLRLPPHAARFRPVITGWFAEFGELAEEKSPGQVRYPNGAARFAGATYDPSSHYRAARVLRFRDACGLRPAFLRVLVQHQLGVLAAAFDELALPRDVISRDRTAPLSAYGGFLALRCRNAQALQAALAERGVSTDARGAYLRFGPAPYLSDAQLTDAMATLGQVVTG